MKSKSNPDILKMAAAAAKRSERSLRSKVGVLFSPEPQSALIPNILLKPRVRPTTLSPGVEHHHRQTD